MTKKKTKIKKKKFETLVVIDKNIARALFLIKADSEQKRYSGIRFVQFNNSERSLVATDGVVLLLVKLKEKSQLLEINIADGFYDVMGNTLVRANEQDLNFPKYQDVIPETSVRYTDNILDGIVEIMIMAQIKVNLWKYEKVLKVLNKVIENGWAFTSHDPAQPLLIENETNNCVIQVVMMAITRGVA